MTQEEKTVYKMEEKKKEFYDKFVMKGEPQMILLRDEVEELWGWIEKEINYARMEQDIINNQAFLDKQDKIIQQAKIEENERWLHAFSGYDEESNEPNWATKQRFKKRISELKGE